MLRAETLLNTRLELIENILNQTWWIKPLFGYEGNTFAHGERRDRVTALEVPEDETDEITVRLVCRDYAAQQVKVEKLTQLGLQEE